MKQQFDLDGEDAIARQMPVEAYGNLGTVFLSVGKYTKAEKKKKKALVIRKEIGDKKGEAADYGNLGTMFFKKQTIPFVFIYRTKTGDGPRAKDAGRVSREGFGPRYGLTI